MEIKEDSEVTKEDFSGITFYSGASGRGVEVMRKIY